MSFNTFWNGNRGRNNGPSNSGRGWRGKFGGPMFGADTPQFTGPRRAFPTRGGRGQFNQMFYSNINSSELQWPPFRNQQQFFANKLIDIPQYSQEKPFLSPPQYRQTSPRTPSPLPGSEEYIQRGISEKSALLKRQLELDDNLDNFNVDSATNIVSMSEFNDINTVEDISTKCVEEDLISVRSNKTKKQSKPVQIPTTLSVDEIHEKIINHISNLSYNKKFNFINQSGPSGYDLAVQKIARQKRFELSKALRDMCNNKFKEGDESSAVINSIIPDFDIKIEELPRDLVEQLSSTLNDDVSAFIQNSIDPEQLFQQAADMLSNCDNYNDPIALEPLGDPVIPEVQPVPDFYASQLIEQSNSQEFFNNPMFITNFIAPGCQPPVVPLQNYRNEGAPIPIESTAQTVPLSNLNVETSVPIIQETLVPILETSNNAQELIGIIDLPHVDNTTDIPLPKSFNEIEHSVILNNVAVGQDTDQNIAVVDARNLHVPMHNEISVHKKVNFNLINTSKESCESTYNLPLIEETNYQSNIIQSQLDEKRILAKNILEESKICNSVHQNYHNESSTSINSLKQESTEVIKSNETDTKWDPKKIKHTTSKAKNENNDGQETIRKEVQSSSYNASNSKKYKEMETKNMHSDSKKIKKQFNSSREDLSTCSRSRSLSREVDNLDKRYERLPEESCSRSRSNDKDSEHKSKYDERHSRHRTRHNKEIYRKHYVEEDRGRQLYDKYRECVYSPDQEHLTDAQWYAKYEDHNEVRPTKRFHYEKNIYSQRSKYIDGKSEYDGAPDYEYYRSKVSYTPEQYEEPMHGHHHRSKHSKSHKRTSKKKHKKCREVSPSSQSSSDHSEEIFGKSSKQKSFDVVEERTSNKHIKPLKERLQMLKDFKNFDNKNERPLSQNSTFILEPISPETNTSGYDVVDKLDISSDSNATEKSSCATKLSPTCSSIQRSENNSQQSVESDVQHDKLLPVLDLPLKETNTISINAIEANNIEEPKKAVQRPWKSPGEKKFMMEQLSTNDKAQPVIEVDASTEKMEFENLQTQVHSKLDSIKAICGQELHNNMEASQNETDDLKKPTILHSAEVSSTSDTSGKSNKVEPIATTIKTSTAAVLPVICHVVEEKLMLITTYTQTTKSGDSPKNDDKRNSHSKRKPKLYNIGIQVNMSNIATSTQTSINKLKNTYSQTNTKKLTFKTTSIQTEEEVIVTNTTKSDEKTFTNTIEAKGCKGIIKKMLDLDNEIQRLTLLRQSLYNELDCDKTSEDQFENNLHSNEHIFKTSNSANTFESSLDQLNRSKVQEYTSDVPQGRRGKPKKPKKGRKPKKENCLSTPVDSIIETRMTNSGSNTPLTFPSTLRVSTKASLKSHDFFPTIDIIENGEITTQKDVKKKKGRNLKRKRVETEAIDGAPEIKRITRGRFSMTVETSLNEVQIANQPGLEIIEPESVSVISNVRDLECAKDQELYDNTCNDEEEQSTNNKILGGNEPLTTIDDFPEADRAKQPDADMVQQPEADMAQPEANLELQQTCADITFESLHNDSSLLNMSKESLPYTDLDSDVPLQILKASKPKKKHKSGPLNKTHKQKKSVVKTEMNFLPECVVKIARYSILELEELCETMQSTEHHDPLVEEVLTEIEELAFELPIEEKVDEALTEIKEIADVTEIEDNTEIKEDCSVLEKKNEMSVVEVQQVLPITVNTEITNFDVYQLQDAVNQNVSNLNFSMTFKGFTGAVLVIKVLEETVLAATDQGQVLFFDMVTGNITHTFDISHAAVTSMLLINSNGIRNVYIGSLNASLTRINFDSREVCNEQQFSEPIQCMENAWNILFIGSDRGSLVRFNFDENRVEGTTKIADTNVLMIRATNEGPRKVLLIATRNAPVSIRDASSGLLLRTLEAPFLPTVYTVLFDRCLVYCGTSQHDILVYTFGDGQLVFKHEATKSKGVVCMQIVGNVLFAGCYNGNVYVYNTKTNMHLGTMSGPGGLMLSMAIVSNKIIIVGTKSGKFEAWQIPQIYLDEM